MGQLRTANRRHRRATRQAYRAAPDARRHGLPPGSGRPGRGPVPPHAAAEFAASHPIEIIGRAPIPGGGELHLARCGEAFSIQFGSDELMGSHDHVSEDALATMTRERLGTGDGRVLIGGLGMGFTLRAALPAWSPSAEIVVAELVPEVLAWARGPLAHLFGDSLSDPRVAIELRDVHDIIAGAPGGFDAILLDVDNGPDGFMRPENDRIYCGWGLRSARAALRPAGVLAIWSAYHDDSLAARLADVGFAVEEVGVPAYLGSKDDRHWIWFATKPA